MKYVLEMKAAPGEEQATPEPGPEPMGGDTPPRWSGDPYDEGDETDPADTQWAFTGANGEQAWLDRSDDGTLVGWVRDADGSVIRYTDADGWALDVDDAGMQRGDAPAEHVVEEGAEVGAGEDAEPMDPMADDELDGEMGDEETEPADDFEDTATDFDEDGESPAEDDAEGDTDEEDAFKKRRFGNTEGKSRLRLVYTV